VVTINSYAEDPSAIYSHSSLNTKSSVLIAHSISCLVAITFALKNPSLVSKLILIGPPPSPLSEVTASAQIAHGKAVREAGMRTSGVAEAATTARISSKTKSERIVAISRSKR
jgi:pimeloyl-ACP methyl ester carboxylesterase